jgi:UDP-N-acetylglucosamine 1-carboxyvinyltransferase
MLRVLERIGAEWDAPNHGRREIALRNITNFEAPFELVRTMRASVLVLGPLLARYGRARVSLPGGCAIGARPINLHIEGLKKLGAEVAVEHGYVDARCPRLTGAEIEFDTCTVTGTENLMMAACLARGTTVLKGAAAEPEVADLGLLLTKMGARIEGAGTPVITIHGVDRLRGAEHRIIPDRIEAGTYAVAAAITGGEVRIEGCEPAHLGSVLDHLVRAGAEAQRSPKGVVVSRKGPLLPSDIATQPYPGFPTDMQAQWMALMTQAGGPARIEETVFEARFLHALELQRMGASLSIDGHLVTTHGPSRLSGAEVTASDLRASACLVLAGLVADGATVVHRVYHLDRGYERMEEKLRPLGADVERLS